MLDKIPMVDILETVHGPIRLEDATREELIDALKWYVEAFNSSQEAHKATLRLWRTSDGR